MHRRRRSSLRLISLYAMELLICGVISLPLGSCSILLPSGAMRANRRFPPGRLEVTGTKGLPRTATLTIVTLSGDTLRGRFDGLHPMRADVSDLPMRLELRLHLPRGVPEAAPRYRRGRSGASVPLNDIARVEIRGQASSVAAAFVGGALLDALALSVVTVTYYTAGSSGCFGGSGFSVIPLAADTSLATADDLGSSDGGRLEPSARKR